MFALKLYSLSILLFITKGKAWIFPKTPSASTPRFASTETFSDEEKPAIRIKEGSIVTIDCRLKPEGEYVPEPLIDGVVLHDESPPARLTFALGRGNYLPGLHDLVQGLQVGESVNGVSLDAGWGERRSDLVATIEFAQAAIDDPSQIQSGVELMLANGLKCVVTKVTEKDFTIDANPPLAGATYEASVHLIRVEDGPSMTVFGETQTSRFQVATFALGCFWGGELTYMREPGVVATAVGYTQGQRVAPTYEDVCSGTTGHTEAIAVTYDPDVVSYQRLVHLAMDRLGENKYLKNQVGNDRGTQYRHGVYYHTPEQKQIAEAIIGDFGEDCVTECLPAGKFWLAEDYHQQYLLKGGQSARKGDDTTIRCYG
ncbi:peptide-methionine (S)-S-oxide reductase [Fistulifera solaris]|uniref:peptide-methionine (S)-S-oxide reductase n=1 Tax=Fistulifera solaris TaxID=1519565 RepID=A0A1Z5JHT8_FISSO|nr:peptide-methionine (S)-S-oxide reductase [Fistulifera solaris]|eukprot:GAX13577.1 peptide-methionine (S)-S-oxide reductase [Fistulifera solaris]